MISTAQEDDVLIENQLPARSEAIHDGHPGTFEHHVGQPDQSPDRRPQGDKRKCSTRHLSTGPREHTKQEAAEKAAQSTSNRAVADATKGVLMESFGCPDGHAHDHPPERLWQSRVGVQNRPYQPADESTHRPANQPEEGVLDSLEPAPIRSAHQPQTTADRAAHTGCRHGRCDDGPKIDGRSRFTQGTQVANRSFKEYPGDKGGPTADNRTIVYKATKRHICPVR